MPRLWQVHHWRSRNAMRTHPSARFVCTSIFSPVCFGSFTVCLVATNLSNRIRISQSASFITRPTAGTSMTVERKNRVFIGGISDRIQKEDIEKEFCRFGKLTNVWVAQNPPGFAFVEFDHISEADLAVSEMNGKTFLGSQNKIRVEHSHGGRSRMRRGGPDGGGGGGGPMGRGPSFSSSRMGGPRDRFSQSSGYRSSDGYSRRRDGYSGGGYDDDKRRSFAPSGRFSSSGGPRGYRSDDRGHSSYGMRRSRSPIGGHSGGYGRMDSMPSYAPMGNYLPNPNGY